MKFPILPERPLLISPSLAATIGLQEALMLQVLADLLEFREPMALSNSPGLKGVKIAYSELLSLLGFWELKDIKYIQANLENLGMLTVESTTVDDEILVAINDQGHAKVKSGNEIAKSTPKMVEVPNSGAASLMPIDWQPDQNWIRLCEQHLSLIHI